MAAKVLTLQSCKPSLASSMRTVSTAGTAVQRASLGRAHHRARARRRHRRRDRGRSVPAGSSAAVAVVQFLLCPSSASTKSAPCESNRHRLEIVANRCFLPRSPCLPSAGLARTAKAPQRWQTVLSMQTTAGGVAARVPAVLADSLVRPGGGGGGGGGVSVRPGGGC